MYSCTFSSVYKQMKTPPRLMLLPTLPKHLWHVIRQKDALVPKETVSVTLYMKKQETYITSDIAIKSFTNIQKCVLFFCSFGLKIWWCFNHKIHLWSPCEMRCLTSFGQGKISQGTCLYFVLTCTPDKQSQSVQVHAVSSYVYLQELLNVSQPKHKITKVIHE